ncbi:hypothetical protein AB0I94_25505 [Streptomyces sp. NPDC050147]|uniref:hypothetical protein n=1 Tax=Streptomyces sp. NPDC050147 TaxID=3155513 RepID=UPI00341678AE
MRGAVAEECTGDVPFCGRERGGVTAQGAPREAAQRFTAAYAAGTDTFADDVTSSSPR